MSDNLKIYNAARVVPNEAQKEIQAGRLKGKTDINPMWRIKLLTELFGVCGFGWKYVITKQWIENGGNNEVSAFVNIDLFVKMDGEWSEAIPGTGGSAFIANERNGLYTSDECFKMALTDAISVSCKALGVGADIYWQKDSTKYDTPKSDLKGDTGTQGQGNINSQLISEAQAKRLFALSKGNTQAAKEVMLKHGYTESKQIKKSDYEAICEEIQKAVS
jgi:hypothetical protein